MYAVAEELYLAVEHRCDLELPAENDRKVILNMENEQATKLLRQSVVSWGRVEWGLIQAKFKMREGWLLGVINWK